MASTFTASLRNASLCLAIALTIFSTTMQAELSWQEQHYGETWRDDYWQTVNHTLLHQMLITTESSMLQQLQSIKGRALTDEEYSEMLGEMTEVRNEINAPLSSFYTSDNFLRPDYVDVFEDEVNKLSPFWDFEID